MGTLYEITGDYLRLMEMLEDNETLDEQVFKDTLEAIDGDFEVKADNYARIIRELHGEAEKYAKEINRMQARMNIISNNEARLKRYLYDAMKATGKVKFKTGLFSFGIHKNGGKQPLEILQGVEIPDKYCRKEPDSGKIRAALEGGEKLDFAELRERGDHLSIK